ncbi:CPBP family intramembrane glutamic endopeptidase [Uliginosibacterium gangwonense]|uniref:CPBP family intramembrane glutamic endopeptidase n=1 Tax=Uliginosibacterium gangwonense TaxID=392736 RepID=UPI0024805079|nr:CPBP family intramembrane glutamic endopeptidase [Uliginosibacterium gangwonense]
MTVFAEEAFFRGLIQGGLTRMLASRTPYAYPIALGVSSTLFALVHLPWGIAFSAMALLAGLFYGTMAGRTPHLDRAIAAHFLTNASIALCLHSPLA